MTEDFNPYIPPKAGEPSARPLAVPDGSLWRVDDGKLLVRNMASLPDYCIISGPGDDPGKRHSIKIHISQPWTKFVWVLPLLALALGGTGYLGQETRSWFLIASGIVALSPRILGEKLRVMTFQSDRASRLIRSKRLLAYFSASFLAAGIVHLIQSNGLLPEHWNMIVLVGILCCFYSLLDFMPLRVPSGALKAGDGWFEMKGVNCEMITRLTEIQKWVVIPQEPWASKRKR